MTNLQRFVGAIEGMIGKLETMWEGPKPHDFRNMKERGVRFVHSELFYKLPCDPFGIPIEDPDYIPDVVYFSVAVGDDEAAKPIIEAITAAGFAPRYERAGAGECYGRVKFDVRRC